MPVILALCLLPVLLGLSANMPSADLQAPRLALVGPLTALAGTVMCFWSAITAGPPTWPTAAARHRDAALHPRSSRCAPLPGTDHRLPPLAAGLAAQGD